MNMTTPRSRVPAPWGLPPLALAVLAALAAPRGDAAPDPDPEPPAAWPRTSPADRARSAGNLKQIALAFHNHNDAYNGLPAHAIYSKAGKPLLSWRVALLPFLEEAALYKEFRLEEPWDSAHNKKLLARMPRVYAPPVSGKPVKPNATYYQVFTGPDTPFDPRAARGAAPVSLGARIPASFPDGTSNTLLVVEAAEAVPWTKPADLPYDARKAVPKLGGLFPEGFHAALVDGSVTFLGRKIDEKALRALITPAGGEVIDWKKVPLARPPAARK
jgi:hypothetical protein